MKKLLLDADELAVESFPTSAVEERAKGTVAAAEISVATAQCGSGGHTPCGARARMPQRHAGR